MSPPSAERKLSTPGHNFWNDTTRPARQHRTQTESATQNPSFGPLPSLHSHIEGEAMDHTDHSADRPARARTAQHADFEHSRRHDSHLKYDSPGQGSSESYSLGTERWQNLNSTRYALLPPPAPPPLQALPSLPPVSSFYSRSQSSEEGTPRLGPDHDPPRFLPQTQSAPPFERAPYSNYQLAPSSSSHRSIPTRTHPSLHVAHSARRAHPVDTYRQRETHKSATRPLPPLDDYKEPVSRISYGRHDETRPPFEPFWASSLRNADHVGQGLPPYRYLDRELGDASTLASSSSSTSDQSRLRPALSNALTSDQSPPMADEQLPRKIQKSHVQSACVNCKRAHLACDVSRPCQRCINLGKTDTCIDVRHKKRGRPRLRSSGASTTPRMSRPSSLAQTSPQSTSQTHVQVTGMAAPAGAFAQHPERTHGPTQKTCSSARRMSDSNVPHFDVRAAERDTSVLDIDPGNTSPFAHHFLKGRQVPHHSHAQTRSPQRIAPVDRSNDVQHSCLPFASSRVTLPPHTLKSAAPEPGKKPCADNSHAKVPA